MITISNLYKSFGPLDVLKGISLQIENRRIAYIVGPNGSGKTTLLKILLGLIKNYSGEIIINGEKINGESQYRSQIGYMPQRASFPENLTVKHIFELVKELRNQSENLDEELIGNFYLSKEMNKRVKTLSGGTLQKVSAALAFLFNPSILILDEPTAGLDPVSSSILKDKIKTENQNGRTILFTSHIVSELEDLAEDIIFLLDGKIYFDGSLNNLIAHTGEQNLERSIASVMLRRL